MVSNYTILALNTFFFGSASKPAAHIMESVFDVP